MGYLLVRIIDILTSTLVLVIIVDIVLSYFLSPYHPLRAALDKIVQPLLTPIRRVVPLVGVFDFSPLVLIILIEIVSYLLKILVSFL